MTIILLLFGTTTLVQAFVIPSASMEDTLLIGDHVLVDKLVYAPPGAFAKMLPYREPRRGDIIVFRYPLNISDGLRQAGHRHPRGPYPPGEQAAHAERPPVNEPYAVHSQPYTGHATAITSLRVRTPCRCARAPPTCSRTTW